MKFSYNWICELVEGVKVSPRELGHLITMKTAECEAVEPFGAHLEKVCAARVIEAEPLAGTRNKKVLVDTGRYGLKTVVCGAPNCRPGMTSAYVPAGVMLPGGEIRCLEIAGVVSDGMLASGAELGVNRDAEGILEFLAEPGDPVPGCRPDWVLEIDNKSITHRPDLWGHLGLAREVAAILRLALRDPVRLDWLPEAEADLEVVVQDYALCPRYSALTFEMVTVQSSPLWLAYRLETIGLNPINNIVDVTNFVMAELAQPMHAFDRDMLRGNTIFVRQAAPGEFLVALNGETYKLDPATVVIADARGPVAIGGVIGGLDAGIVAGTRRIVLESANFHASNIRKTSGRLKLRTDASMRFEKGQDPANTVRGLARALELFQEVSPGIRLSGGLADAGRELPPPPRIALELDWMERKLGRKVPREEVVGILRALAFGVEEESPRRLVVSVPSWRATRDVSIKDDLVEEVGRMVGYDSITPQAPLIPSAPPPANEIRTFHHVVREMLAAQGFTEVYNYSFLSEETARRFGFDPAEHVAVLNPIAGDQRLLRRSLVPGIWKNVTDNSRHFDSFRIFEIGYEIHKRAGELPEEVDHLAAAVYEREGDGRAGLFELKRLAECLMPGCEVRPAAPRCYEHPARSWELLWRELALGRLFELHPELCTGRAALFDVDLEKMRRLGPPPRRYQPPRRFPSSAFDLSVVAGLRDLAGDIERRLVELAGENLESIRFLRQYSGPPLPEGKQSLTWRLAVSAADHTLTADEVSAIRRRLIDGLRAAGYDLRL